MLEKLLILLALCDLTNGSQCHFDSAPTRHLDEQGHPVLTYLEEDKPIFWQSDILPSNKALQDLRNDVKKQTSVDQDYLLIKQRAIFNRHIATGIDEFNHLLDSIVSKQTGRINVINCLEALLYGQHLSMQGTKKPTEFSAILYRLNIEGKPYLKIILKSNSVASGPDMMDEIEKSDLIPWAFLHNHIFVFENYNTGDIAGTLIPSGLAPPGSFDSPMADLKYFRNLAKKFGLAEAWITNGFDTSHFAIWDFTGEGKYWIY